MFTGIVEKVGVLRQIRQGSHSAVFSIQADELLEGVKPGDSIAVNGICLTVTSIHGGMFTADVMHETLNRSAFSRLSAGAPVNLERAMPADGRFGGHFVSGHVDGTGRILAIRQDDTAVWFRIQAEPQLLRLIVEKGSIAVDGISLTVAAVDQRSFSVSTIPHTLSRTTLRERRVGGLVNLETDMIGKYVEKLVCPLAGKQENFLKNWRREDDSISFH